MTAQDYNEESEVLTEVEIQILQGLERLGGSYQQRNLWKYIGIDSKTGLPILARLEKRGLIVRERVGGNKRGMYVIRLTERAYKLLTKMHEEAVEAFTINIDALPEEYRLLLSLPCTYCPYSDKCGVGFITPLNCELMAKWSHKKI
ncbi:helix-turn-helix transcriptional regulator [Pyrobaculum aerophilum]|uniref:DNA binding transcriptional repressor, conjectural n=2 Tax=Pyrobaculum aerophilum TaxID=13773 RepID=Q8ZTC1_PYRAE|nr:MULTISPECIES: MarR family transcriptional regulator [Pyrobaculum]AAL64841.1 DNA binding transcriptional repressor, conjectural [Pyrobaculum aerophilum str. IM2]MCX8135501.1 MarR family transcriptional regulator [Pyrobaculum aerophilum]HII47548.1 MarR family transcriptional regulator [Pyrobaculum aerophilum]